MEQNWYPAIADLVRNGSAAESADALAKLVGAAVAKGAPLEALSLEDLKDQSPLFEEDALRCLSAEGMVEGRARFDIDQSSIVARRSPCFRPASARLRPHPSQTFRPAG